MDPRALDAAIAERVDRLIASERWTDEERAARLEERVTALLEAARSSPYWAEAAGDARTLADLPLLDRDTVRARYDDLLTGAGEVLSVHRTSGSTGRPVSVALGAETIAWSAAARWRQLTWFGLPPTEHSVANIVSRLPADHPPVRHVDDDPRRYAINPFKFDRRGVEEIHTTLAADGGVTLVGGNTSMLEQWAEQALDAGLDGRELGVRLVVVGSEVTAPQQRELIERAFAAPTAEMYGASEVPMIGAECAEGSLHLNEEIVAVEVLRTDGSAASPGELGEVAVTMLHSIEMPMLRYRIGDAAAVLDGACPCGRTLPRLDLRVAHLEEMVLTRDGRLLHPRFIRTEFETLGPVRRFHAVQRGPGDFVVFLDLDGELDAGTAERVEQAVAAFTGEPVSFELVADPERATGRLPSGKRRAFTRTFNP